MGVDEKKPQDWKIRQYYEQEELINKFLKLCEYREVTPTYEKGYGKRPDAINFRGDLEQFIENGAIAFHGSVEKWKNPLLIDNVSDLDNLRTGWDLVIDIDCDESFEISKKTTKLVINELEQHGIENISVKFSGNRGFHIGIRSEAFPKKIEDQEIAKHYPRLPRGIVDYIRDNVRTDLIQIIKENGFKEEILTEDGLDPFQFADIENDWGQRHLFRLPYSINEKSWLVSKPIKKHRVENFSKKEARIENIDFEESFLKEYSEGEAEELAIKVLDYLEKKQRKKKKKRAERNTGEYDRPEDAVPEKYFPPTINNILEGLEDGRKRGLFILINFLRTVGYSWEEIEAKIWDWNEENKEALNDSYVKTQLRWHKNRSETVPPPNYDSNGYYKDMNVYEGDNLEEKVSNPVSYAFRKSKNHEDSEEDDKEEYVCPYCGKEYEIESYFKKHVQECFE